MLLLYVEVVGGDSCGHEVQGKTRLGGIVRCAHVVEETEIGIGQTACLQLQVVVT